MWKPANACCFLFRMSVLETTRGSRKPCPVRTLRLELLVQQIRPSFWTRSGNLQCCGLPQTSQLRWTTRTSIVLTSAIIGTTSKSSLSSRPSLAAQQCQRPWNRPLRMAIVNGGRHWQRRWQRSVAENKTSEYLWESKPLLMGLIITWWIHLWAGLCSGTKERSLWRCSGSWAPVVKLKRKGAN